MNYRYHPSRITTFALALLIWTAILAMPAIAQRGALNLDTEGYAAAADDDALDLASESITVEAWIMHDGESAADAVILTKSQSTSIDYELSLVGSGEEVPVRFSIYSSNYYAQSDIGVSAHRWTHIAGTYDGTTISIYVNGELQGTRTTTSASLLTNTPLTVGANTNGSARFFSGMIDEIRIWDVVRSANTIDDTVYGELDGDEAGLRAYYSFATDGADMVGDNDLDLIGSASVVGPGVFPVAPSLYAAAGNASIALEWNEQLGDDDANQAAEFNVYRSTEPDYSDRELLATVSETSYTDASASNGSTYYYQVTSVDDGGVESDFSYSVAATPYGQDGGASLSFDGDGYATVSNRPSLTLGNESLSVEAWVKHDGSSDADAVILTKRDGNTIDYELSFAGSGEESAVRFYIYSENYFAESTTGIAAGQWTHLAGTYDGSTISLYVNGELQDTRGTTGETLPTDTPLTFGAATNGNSRFYSGLVDEVRIWDVVRPLLQIRQNYRTRLTGGENGLRAYFAFDTPGADAPHGLTAGGTATVNLEGTAEITSTGVYPLPPFTYAEPLGTTAVVSWRSRTAATPGQYRIYRSTERDLSDRELLASVGGAVTAYTDTDLDEGTSYYYQVASVTSGGQASDMASPASTTAAAARDGNALQVGGSGGYAQVDDRPSIELANQSMTVEAWIRHDGESDTDAVILTKRNGTSIDYELSLVGSGDDLPVRFTFYGPPYFAESSVTIPADVWTHVAGTYDGTTLSIYVNGTLAGTRTTSGASLPANAPLTIGANTNGNGRFFSGLIDEVRIWDVVRTGLQIRQTYLDVLTGDEEGLRAYFRFDETGGDIAFGSATNGMSAALQGTAAFTASQSPVDVEKDASIPEAFVLDGNYPNPFNPRTVIRFGLDAAGTVRVAVFDLTGRQVAVILENEALSAGWHEVPFDASGLSSGVYLYRVEIGERMHTGRMTLVK